MSASGIVAYDPGNPEHVDAIARLHAELLPDSPIPRLGNIFMKKFYYKKLVEAGIIRCELFKSGGRYAAFSVWTEFPYTFMEKGKKRFFASLCSIVFLCLLQNPLRVKVVLEVMRQVSGRKAIEDDGVSGEYLSLGILPEAAQERDERTGLRIPEMMFESVIRYFKAHGFKEILLMIRKTNKKSQMFYHSFGAVMKPADFVPPDCYLMTVKVA